MLVQLTSLDPIWTLFTIIGILTLFGKKKKDEKEDGETGEASTPTPASTSNFFDAHSCIDIQLFYNIYSNSSSSCSGKFTYSSKPFAREHFKLLSTAEKLAKSSAGRRG